MSQCCGKAVPGEKQQKVVCCLFMRVWTGMENSSNCIMKALLNDDASSYTKGFSQGETSGISVCWFFLCFLFVKASEERYDFC